MSKCLRQVHHPKGRVESAHSGCKVFIPDTLTQSGTQGILNPILEKYKEGALTSKIFGVPAMQAVIDWKWVRRSKC